MAEEVSEMAEGLSEIAEEVGKMAERTGKMAEGVSKITEGAGEIARIVTERAEMDGKTFSEPFPLFSCGLPVFIYPSALLFWAGSLFIYTASPPAFGRTGFRYPSTFF